MLIGTHETTHLVIAIKQEGKGPRSQSNVRLGRRTNDHELFSKGAKGEFLVIPSSSEAFFFYSTFRHIPDFLF